MRSVIRRAVWLYLHPPTPVVISPSIFTLRSPGGISPARPARGCAFSPAGRAFSRGPSSLPVERVR